MAVITSEQLETQEYTLGSRASLEVLTWQVLASAFVSDATFVIAQHILRGVTAFAMAGSNATGTDGDIRVYGAFYEDGDVDDVANVGLLNSLAVNDGAVNNLAGVCSIYNINATYATKPMVPIVVMAAELDGVGAGSGLLTARLLLYRA